MKSFLLASAALAATTVSASYVQVSVKPCGSDNTQVLKIEAGSLQRFSFDVCFARVYTSSAGTISDTATCQLFAKDNTPDVGSKDHDGNKVTTISPLGAPYAGAPVTSVYCTVSDQASGDNNGDDNADTRVAKRDDVADLLDGSDGPERKFAPRHPHARPEAKP